jgi:hypothetical protein
MPAQDVLVAVCAQVQKAAGGRHEFDRCLHLRIGCHISTSRPCFGLADRRQRSPPLRCVVIAQAARRLFHIWFQVKYRAAETRVAVIE